MKKRIISAAVLLLTVVSACQKEPARGHHEGDVIVFASTMSAETAIATKAYYSGEVEGTSTPVEKIFWNEGDMVRVYSPQASARNSSSLHYSDYVVGNVQSDRRKAFISNPEGTNGLVWGTGNHDFYAMWPAPSTTDLPGLTIDGARAVCTLPASQAPTALTSASGDVTFTPDSRMLYLGAATEGVSPSIAKNPSLTFKPIPTVLQFTVTNGFANNASMFITGADLLSEEDYLIGTFACNLTGGVGASGTAMLSGGGRIVSVPTTIKAGTPSLAGDATPVEIASGKSITFSFYIYPKDDGVVGTDGLTLRLRVAKSATAAPMAKSLRLKYSATATSHTPGSDVVFEPYVKHICTGLLADDRFDLAVNGDLVDWTNGLITDKEPVEADYVYNLTVSTPAEFTYEGGTNEFTVFSTKSTEVVSVDTYVKMEYSVDGGTSWSVDAPSWLTIQKKPVAATSAVGPVQFGSTQTYQATVSAQVDNGPTIYHEQNHTAALRAKTPKSDFDLSLRNPSTGASCAMTTANTYVVDAPGSYKFPMVYGNAIQNGATNTLSYNPLPESSDYAAAVLRNHVGRKIIDPWIKNNYLSGDLQNEATTLIGTAALTASLLWQDQPGVITSVGISGDYVTFNVSSTAIHECNALIALKANDIIVWSWQIWVTDVDLSVGSTLSYGGRNYKLMCQNLGNCNDGVGHTYNYDERVCQVRISQVQGDKSEIVTIRQKPDTFGTIYPDRANSPYYQIFRKDPFIAANGFTTSDKPAYSLTGTVSKTWSFVKNANNSISETILNPTKFYFDSSSSRPCNDYDAFNFWSGNLTTFGNYQSTVTQKTIYDPSPAGFKVPNPDALSGLVSMSYFCDMYGHCVVFGNDQNLIFQLSGQRSRDSGSVSSSIKNEGYAATGVPNSRNQAYRLSFDESGATMAFNAMCHGRPVRPMFE